MGRRKMAYRDLVGNPERKSLIGRPRLIWEDNINIDLTETGDGGADWIHLAQSREQWRTLVSTIMNHRFL
jgi:hypothetical protein